MKMSIDYIILGLLSMYPQTGYDLKAETGHPGTAMIWGQMSFGSIYPRLQKLVEDGLAEAVEEKREGRGKKVYDLTEAGWQALYDWVALPPEDPLIRDELMAKILFVGTARPEDRQLLVRHLRKRKMRSEELVAFYREWPVNGVSAVSEFGLLVMDHAISQLEAELAWIDRTIVRLEGPPQPDAQDPTGLFVRMRERRNRHLPPRPRDEK